VACPSATSRVAVGGYNGSVLRADNYRLPASEVSGRRPRRRFPSTVSASITAHCPPWPARPRPHVSRLGRTMTPLVPSKRPGVSRRRDERHVGPGQGGARLLGPQQSGSADIGHVSCASVGHCSAVGFYPTHPDAVRAFDGDIPVTPPRRRAGPGGPVRRDPYEGPGSAAGNDFAASATGSHPACHYQRQVADDPHHKDLFREY
jgi:hypothetical protein